MKKILIFVLLLISSLVFSQSREATIFFTDGTSVEGYGEINENVILFKVEQSGIADEWTFDVTKGIEFSGYGYSEKYEYVKLNENKDPKLLAIVDNRSVSLYRDTKLTTNLLINPFSQTGAVNMVTNAHPLGNSLENIYYVKRENENIATNISSNFKKKVSVYFSDCKILIDKINSKKFTSKNIEDLVFYYNDYCGKDEGDK